MNRYPEYVSSESYWFDEVPSHWEKTRNKFIFYSDKSTVGGKWGEFDLLTMGKEGVRLRDMDGGGKFPESFENYKVVKPNQLIFCLFDMDETPRTVGFSNLHGMITSAYDVFSCKNNVNPKFVNYFYQSIDDVKGLRPYYTGLRKVIRSDTFMGINIYIPPLQEQNLISKYLDKKTSQIDSLIEKIQQKIELLKEQRTSLINHCVTKGLDPDVEMKDSGVEWIGEIPSHWNVILLRHVSSLVNKKRLPVQGEKKISPEHVESETGKITNYYSDHGAEGLEFQPDDTLLNKLRVYLSKVVFCDFSGLSMGEMIVLRPIKYNPKYQFHVISSSLFIDYLNSLSEGVKLPRTPVEGIMRTAVPFPPQNEQVLISKHLDKKTSKINSLIEKETKRIELLKEYRQSLISNVVTGKVRIMEEMI